MVSGVPIKHRGCYGTRLRVSLLGQEEGYRGTGRHCSGVVGGGLDWLPWAAWTGVCGGQPERFALVVTRDKVGQGSVEMPLVDYTTMSWARW
jgi:hypothetical protein